MYAISEIVKAIDSGDIETAKIVASWFVEYNPNCDMFYEMIAGLNLDPEVRESVCKFAREELCYYLTGGGSVVC